MPELNRCLETNRRWKYSLFFNKYISIFNSLPYHYKSTWKSNISLTSFYIDVTRSISIALYSQILTTQYNRAYSCSIAALEQHPLFAQALPSIFFFVLFLTKSTKCVAVSISEAYLCAHCFSSFAIHANRFGSLLRRNDVGLRRKYEFSISSSLHMIPFERGWLLKIKQTHVFH